MQAGSQGLPAYSFPEYNDRCPSPLNITGSLSELTPHSIRRTTQLSF